VSNAEWETLSNQAITAAGVVYFLALISHLVEWSALRKVPVRAAARVAVPAGAGPSESPAASSSTGGDTSYRIEMFGRLGLYLTIIAAGAHFLGLVGRGMAAAPNPVPGGNM
jgi:hypothetical protein